jgi:uracil-DNA glycosylase family 4
LHAGAKTVCIEGSGPKDAEILVVGQNPGKQEDRVGRPFVGPSGKLLKAHLDKAGFDSTSIRYTNIVRCATPQDRAPSTKEIKACKPYLDAEIAAVKPKYVITLGAPATKAVTKQAKISAAHGQMIERDDITYMPTYHVAASFRDPSKLTAIDQDFERLRRHVDGTLGETQDTFDYAVIHKREDLAEFWTAFDAADEYAFDTETNGLIHAAKDFVVRSIAIALEHKVWVIPLEMPGSLYEHNWQAQSAYMRVLARKTVEQDKWVYVFHGKFDAGALRWAYQVSVPYHWDGQLAHHLLDENQDHDLKYVARIELDCPEYDLPKALKHSDTPKWLELMQDPANREKYWEYNARDAWNTFHFGRKSMQKLRGSAALRKLLQRLVMPASYALADIEAEGLPLDLAKYADVETRIRATRDLALHALNLEAGEAINWDSWQQVGRVLFEKLKLPILQRTPTGGASTSEAAIVDLKGTHPIVDQLLHYRELDKILGTYLEGWRKNGHVIGKKLYLSYTQHGTVGGRFSSRLHSIPTDGDIRSIIAADDDPEWQFWAADLSQAELRIATEFSGDPTLTRIYQNGEDVHWNTVLFLVGAGHMPEYIQQALKTAAAINVCRRGKPTLNDALAIMRIAGAEKCTEHWKEWKRARTDAKRCAFGFLYGMYENTFIEKAKIDYDWMCTWEQAHGFRQGFFETYAGLSAWHEREKKLARLDGQVSNLFGRIRRLPAIHSTDREARGEAERQAVNIRVQSTIGDWKSAAMIEINSTIPKTMCKLAGEHHDALLGLVRRGHEDEVLPKVRKIMEHPKLLDTFGIRLRVPMCVDVNVGAWGAGQKYRDPT